MAVPLGDDHGQVREVRETVGPQQVHSQNQDLPLAKEKDQPQALAQSHDQTNGEGQQQGKASCLQWCWVQGMLLEKKQQQQVMGVEKRRLGDAVVIEDEVVQAKVEYIVVVLVLPPVEGEEQGQVVE